MDNHEVPMRLFHCVGNDQAVRLIASHVFVVVLYWIISVRRFLPAALHAKTKKSKIVWWSIAFIFPFCATAGYGTTILAGWCPSIAYPLKEFMCYLDVLACIAFLASSNKKQLQVIGDDSLRAELHRVLENANTSDVLCKLKEML